MHHCHSGSTSEGCAAPRSMIDLPMKLFDANPPDAVAGYGNIRAAPDSSDLGRIRAGLEELWDGYEPYADSGFREEFARHPDERFWEMYLAFRMLEAGRKLR